MNAIPRILLQLAVATGAPLTRSDFSELLFESGFFSPAASLSAVDAQYKIYLDRANEALRTRVAKPAGEFISLGEYGFIRARDISMIRRLTSKSGEAFIEIRLADGASFDYPAGSTAETNIMNWLHADRGQQ